MTLIAQGRNCAAGLAGAMVPAASMAAADTAVNATAEGVAVDGIDVVAYFTDNAPAEGSPPKVAANTPKVLAGLIDGTTAFYPHSSDPSVGISHPQSLD